MGATRSWFLAILLMVRASVGSWQKVVIQNAQRLNFAYLERHGGGVDFIRRKQKASDFLEGIAVRRVRLALVSDVSSVGMTGGCSDRGFYQRQWGEYQIVGQGRVAMVIHDSLAGQGVDLQLKKFGPRIMMAFLAGAWVAAVYQPVSEAASKDDLDDYLVQRERMLIAVGRRKLIIGGDHNAALGRGYEEWARERVDGDEREIRDQGVGSAPLHTTATEEGYRAMSWVNATGLWCPDTYKHVHRRGTWRLVGGVAWYVLRIGLHDMQRRHRRRRYSHGGHLVRDRSPTEGLSSQTATYPAAATSFACNARGAGEGAESPVCCAQRERCFAGAVCRGGSYQGGGFPGVACR